jgi:solute:Na+ symporter, SSS family
MILDVIVVLLYAASMLLMGWYGMRRAKTSDDFLVAGRNLGPALYMGTMAAVVLGGASTVGTVRLGYVYGVSGFWLCAMLGLGIIALHVSLAKPLLKLKIYTVTQVLERRYNPAARRASAVIMCAYALMLGVTSCLAIGTILQVLFELPSWASVILGGVVVVVYSAIGGMWSLTLTDIVQFAIKTVGMMFLLLPICLYRVGGWSQLKAKLPASAFHFATIGWGTVITYFLIYFFGIMIGQDVWQRVFTARSARVAQYAGTVAGAYAVAYGLVGSVIGMCARVLIPKLDNANNAYAAIVRDSLPAGLRGLVIAAALAAMMSTASAAILAASTTVTEDLLPWLRGGARSSLAINRLFTTLAGALTLAIALVVSDVISALTVAYNLLVGGMLIPLIGAVYWKRATTPGALACIGVGSVTVIAFMIRDGLDANTPIYYGLGAGFVSFIAVSLLFRPESSEVGLALAPETSAAEE